MDFLAYSCPRYRGHNKTKNKKEVRFKLKTEYKKRAGRNPGPPFLLNKLDKLSRLDNLSK